MSGARAQGISGKGRARPSSTTPPLDPAAALGARLQEKKVLFHELVAHGAAAATTTPPSFSNINDSRQTSLGLFLTEGTYEGGNGCSLASAGSTPGSTTWPRSAHRDARRLVRERRAGPPEAGSAGAGAARRSPREDAPAVIDAVKGGTFVFAYAAGASAPTAPGMRASYSPSHRGQQERGWSGRWPGRPPGRWPASHNAPRAAAPPAEPGRRSAGRGKSRFERPPALLGPCALRSLHPLPPPLRGEGERP